MNLSLSQCLKSITKGIAHAKRWSWFYSALLGHDFRLNCERPLCLYKWVFPVELPHPTLSLVDAYNVYGPHVGALEMRSRWVAAVLSGRCRLPGNDTMKAHQVKQYKYMEDVCNFKVKVRTDSMFTAARGLPGSESIQIVFLTFTLVRLRPIYIYVAYIRKWRKSTTWHFNSLAPGRFDCSPKLVNFKLSSTINIFSIICEIAIRWMPQHLTDHHSTLVQVMAWCRQATSHYLSQCWPRSMSPYGVIRPQWVKITQSTDVTCWNDMEQIFGIVLGYHWFPICMLPLYRLLFPLTYVYRRLEHE